MHRAPTMVKFKNLWLFEHSEFQMFLNFIIDQYMAKIRTKPKSLSIIYFYGNANYYFVHFYCNYHKKHLD